MDNMATDERMNADDCNGRSYTQGNGGETSMEQDFYGPVQGPARSPNSQQSSPRRSLSANSIKVELCSEDESPGAQQPESREAVKEDSRKDGGGDPMEEGNTQFTGAPRDRVTIYSEMASPNAASPGPIRLPNGKLQCEVCGIECVGPNVLMVHKRSHTGERPFHCNQCGASFTQKGNLLRHIKLHSGEKPFKCPSCNYACRRRDALAGHLRTHAASSPMMGKPFKCNYCSRSYKQQSTLEEHLECCQNYLKSLDHQATVNRQSKTQGEESANMEIIRKRVLQPSSERIQFVERLANSITKRKRSTPQKFLGEKHMHLNPPEAPYELSSGSEKDGDLMSSQPTGDSAGLPSSRLQGTKGKDTESTAEEQSTRATAPTSTSNNHHLHYQTPALPRSLPTSSPSQAKYLEPDWERACVVPAPPVKKILSSPLSSRETVQVLDRNGRPVRSFPCHHCSILFLDHVMFTIHMGCHGFRQPFECNICGHLSQDRYEFSSHISRGEHQVG
ncbi:zinc finger protein Eos isoform X3 [Cynoglossus semilaevis]|uniref:zinc finger protein Eos isoform X3 n=1 Tax=Cynoglossus semilaevis TaxID=244447 RepID=UPI000D62A40B|nr:zinc finger protein Eos-like isoform X3 [Cynoglossus semilaevis]